MPTISPYSDVVDFARFVIGIVLLSYASWSDWKSRRVVNAVWYIVCGAGIMLIEIQFFLANAQPAYFFSPVVGVLIFTMVINDFVLFFDHPSKALKIGASAGAYGAIAAMIYYQFNTIAGDTLFHYMLAMYLMILIARFMYDFRLLHGGADAKAIMSLALLLPFMPAMMEGLPILRFTVEPARSIYLYVEPMFPPALIVLFNAVVFFIFAPLAFLVYNAIKREVKFPQCLFGYMMPRDAVVKKYVWLMEKFEDGKRKAVVFQRDDSPVEEQLSPFIEHDIQRVWVTPKLPFMIPILLGYILAFIVGNIMFGLILALGG